MRDCLVQIHWKLNKPDKIIHKDDAKAMLEQQHGIIWKTPNWIDGKRLQALLKLYNMPCPALYNNMPCPALYNNMPCLALYNNMPYPALDIVRCHLYWPSDNKIDPESYHRLSKNNAEEIKPRSCSQGEI